MSSMNHAAQSAMLVNTPRRNYKLQRLHVYDGGGRNSISGINATVFGASSVLGMSIGSLLTSIGSTVVYPYRSQGTLWDFKFKEIKPTADLGYKAYVKLRDMKDSFKISKYIGMVFIDAFLSTQPNKRDDFITRMYLYASSATEQSSYFVKLAD